MFLFTRLQLISAWLIVQATTSLERQVTYTEHPTTTAHQVFTALQSDSTVSKALEASMKEPVTARSPDVASQVDQQRRYQPAILVVDTSNTTVATHNQTASLETFNVASENSSTRKQQLVSLQSHKSSKEQPASASLDSPSGQSRKEADQETSILRATEQKTTVVPDMYLAPRIQPTTLLTLKNTTQLQTTVSSYAIATNTAVNSTTEHVQDDDTPRLISLIQQAHAILDHQNINSLPKNSSYEEQIPTPSSTAEEQETAVPNALSTPQYQTTNPVSHNSYAEKLLTSVFGTSTTLASVHRTKHQTTTEAQPQFQVDFQLVPLPAVILRAPEPITTEGSVVSSVEEHKSIHSSTAEVQATSVTDVHPTPQYQTTNIVQSLPLHPRNSYTEQSKMFESQLNPSPQIASLIAGEPLSSVDQVNLTQEQLNITSYGQPRPTTSTPHEVSFNQISSLLPQNTSIGQKISSLDQPATSLRHQNTISLAQNKSFEQPKTLTSFNGYPLELHSSISQNIYPSRPLSPVVQLHSTLEQKNSTSLVQNSTQYGKPITVTPLKGSSANLPSLTLQNNSTTQPSSVVDQVTSAQEQRNNTSLTQTKYHGQSVTVKPYESTLAKVQTMVSSNSSSLQPLLSVEKLTLPIQKQNFTFMVQNGSNGQPTTVSSHYTSSTQLSSRKRQNSILEQTNEPYVNSTPKLQPLPSLFQNDSAEQLATTSTRPYSTIKLASLITKDNYTEQLLSIMHQGNTTYKQQPTSLIYGGKPTTDLFDVGSKVQNATLIPYNGNTEHISTSASRQNLSIKLYSLILQSNSAEQPSPPVHQTKLAEKSLSQDSPFGLKPTSAESQANSFVQLTIFIPQNNSIPIEIPPSALHQTKLTVEQKVTTALQPTNLVSQKYSAEQSMTVSASIQSNSLRTTLAHKHTVEQNSSVIHQDNSTILRSPNKNSSWLSASPVLVVNSTLQQKFTSTSTIDDESTPKPFTLLPEISSSEHKFKTTKFSVHSPLQEKNSTSFTVQTTAASSQFYSTQQSTAIILPLLRKGKKLLKRRERKKY